MTESAMYNDTLAQMIDRADHRSNTIAFQKKARLAIRLSSSIPREQLEMKFTI